MFLKVGGFGWWLQVGASQNQKRLDISDFADVVLCFASGEGSLRFSAGQ